MLKLINDQENVGSQKEKMLCSFLLVGIHEFVKPDCVSQLVKVLLILKRSFHWLNSFTQ